MRPPTVLVVDDDARTVETVALYLRHAGYHVLTAGEGSSALDTIRGGKPDLVVLDVMLPEVGGFEICRTIRESSDLPIIMLTARATEDDTLRGLRLGADDYVTKPFSPRELVARVDAVLRRHGAGGVLVHGELAIDRRRRVVRLRDRPVDLTATEFDLLALLASSPGRVFTRGQLVEHLRRADAECLERTVDAHVMNLRRKIEVDRSQPRFIVTVYGVGYRFGGDA